jgi:hypothetical protein
MHANQRHARDWLRSTSVIDCHDHVFTGDEHFVYVARGCGHVDEIMLLAANIADALIDRNVGVIRTVIVSTYSMNCLLCIPSTHPIVVSTVSGVCVYVLTASNSSG